MTGRSKLPNALQRGASSCRNLYHPLTSGISPRSAGQLAVRPRESVTARQACSPLACAGAAAATRATRATKAVANFILPAGRGRGGGVGQGWGSGTRLPRRPLHPTRAARGLGST